MYLSCCYDLKRFFCAEITAAKMVMQRFLFPAEFARALSLRKVLLIVVIEVKHHACNSGRMKFSTPFVAFRVPNNIPPQLIEGRQFGIG